MKKIVFLLLLISIGISFYNNTNVMNYIYESYYRFINGNVLYLGEKKYCLNKDYFIYSAKNNSYVFSQNFVNPNYMGLDYAELKKLNDHKKDVIYRYELPDDKTIFMVRHFDESVILSGDSESIISGFIKGKYLAICKE